MLVYLVRHGQSFSNRAGVRNGQTDVPLTEQGFLDAKNAGEKLKGIKFDRVISSDLIRAVQTAQTAIEGTSPQRDSRLREIDVGKLAGHTPSECREFFENYDENNLVQNYLPYDGENAEMVATRIKSFMNDLEAVKDCENVAIFAHQGSIFYILRYVLDFPIFKTKIALDNGSITIIEYSGQSWKILKTNM